MLISSLALLALGLWTILLVPLLWGIMDAFPGAVGVLVGVLFLALIGFMGVGIVIMGFRYVVEALRA